MIPPIYLCPYYKSKGIYIGCTPIDTPSHCYYDQRVRLESENSGLLKPDERLLIESFINFNKEQAAQ